MHKWAKSIMECVKTKVDAIGIDNFSGENLCELEKWSKIAKNIAEYDYYYNIIKAMEENEDDYGETWDENGPIYRKGYKNRMRKYPEMDMDMYKMNPEELRRRDNVNGVHYYTETGTRRIDMARKKYEDSKDMQSLNEFIDSMMAEIDEKMPHMDASQKAIVKQKLANKSASIK